MYKESITSRVTCINGRYHSRLMDNGKVINEMACALKQDTGYCIKYMLRMYDKCGGASLMADASRHRQKGENKLESQPKGKVWYPSQIPVKRR